MITAPVSKRSGIGKLTVCGLAALLLTTLVSAMWGTMVGTNLRTNPGVPWASLVMAVVLWLLWQYAGGRWPPRGTAHARQVSLRARPVSGRVFAWAVAAGILSLIALTGLWIVLFQTGWMRGNSLPDYGQYPTLTVTATLVMASVLGGFSEEAAFRGYLQGMLEREYSALASIAITAVVMAPGHALTQGLAWTTLLFYLVVDGMLGTLAHLCNSVWPGAVVHAVGLLIFFTLVWPSDPARPLASAALRDPWFWTHAGQTVVFAGCATLAFVRLQATEPRQWRPFTKVLDPWGG